MPKAERKREIKKIAMPAAAKSETKLNKTNKNNNVEAQKRGGGTKWAI